jgi:predicted aspartyl protease
VDRVGIAYAPRVSMFHVSVVVRNPKNESLRTPPIDAIIDTGAELSWLPRDLLTGIGIVPRRKRAFRMAAGHVVTRDVGYGIVSAEGFETNDEIIFAEPGDLVLLGVRTIEGFGVLVDNIAHRLVPRVGYAGAAA